MTIAFTKGIIISRASDVSHSSNLRRFKESMLENNAYFVKALLKVLGRARAHKQPDYIKIETTNMCNGRCSYCPRDKLTRPLGTMSDDLFKKLAEEIRDIGIKSVHLQNYGEPLLDKKLSERIRYLKKLSIGNVCIFTNGLLLDEPAIIGLFESGLDEINISLDSAIESVHDSTRLGLPFKQIVNNIERVIELRQSRHQPIKIVLSSIVHDNNNDTMALFLEKWKKAVDEIHIQNMHDWTQGESAVYKQALFPCQRLWLTLTVLWDGRVSLCCVDFDGKVILGDANKENIAAIWNSPVYRSLRLSHLNGDFKVLPKLCTHCQLRLKDSPLWVKRIL